uniref:Mechanosensitive ion channel n=1 Tax=uncultured Thiotrichaceae bacterium TaxID=298394 RepID=A0A6S6TS48_9GAMM|nr:MAG: Unknown protein [uncultured Thiotrichaceae bacterium]
MVKSLFLSVTACLLLMLSFSVNAVEVVTVPTKERIVVAEKLEALQAIIEIKASLNESLKNHQAQLKKVISETEKNNLLEKIATIEKELLETELNFDEIATNTDLSTIKDQPSEKFSLEEEIVSLIRPTLQEMNHLTKDVRNKAELREKIANNSEKQKYIREAIAHLSELLSHAGKNKELKTTLTNKIRFWEKQEALTNSQQTSAAQQLRKLTEAEVPFTESTQNYFTRFFQQRGLYISQALLAMAMIFFLSHLFRSLIKRTVPAFNRRSRSFRLRLLDLFQRVLTFILIIVCPVIVFYMAEDWVLFSFSLLILLGIAWSLKSVIPEYWVQIQLFLNVGSVREGERIFLDGMPWRVEAINIFSILENPAAGIRQRVPIKDLIDLKSRACNNDEPWFPCAKGDWVILSDGVRGKVIGISCEFVKLVQRGGSHKTYQTADFLSLSPLNLSVNFRIKETIGISYDLQAISTNKVLEILHDTIVRRVEEEGHTKDMLNLRVEFEYANTSSLDIVVIADFKGHLGDIYNRLRRAIQRWCVDACTENNWEIPFTQVTLHGGAPEQEITVAPKLSFDKQ